MKMKLMALALMALPLMMTAQVGQAAVTATFDFASLKGFSGNTPNLGAPNPTGPNGAINTGWFKNNDDIVSSNLNLPGFGGSLSYTKNGITVTATGIYNNTAATVIQDHEPGYNAANKIGAGLGVYHLKNDTSDDNVTSGEKLTLSFSQTVKLTGLFLRSDGHDTNFANNDTFLFNGFSTSFGAGASKGNLTGLSVVGNTFTFAYGGTHANQFYLGGMTVAAVPEPEEYAMMLLGFGMVGYQIKRKQKQLTKNVI